MPALRTVTEMRLGSHVSRGTALLEAAATNSDVIQVFVSPPQSWAAPKPGPGDQALIDSGIQVFVHAPYLANPASLNPDVREKTRVSLQQQLNAAAKLGASGLIVHGGHPTGAGTVEDGISGWLEVLQGLEHRVPLLIENTAGGKAAVARRFEDFARLLDSLRGAGHPVGVCLDTCHAHAGGEDLAGVAERLVRFAGAIDFMHVNDSKDSFDSGRDRHENLGSGACTLEHIIEAVKVAACPAVVETPNGIEAQAADVRLLRNRLGLMNDYAGSGNDAR